MSDKQQIKVSTIEDLLEKGYQRPQIAEELGVPLSILQKTVFQHPKLKGKKAKKVYDIEIIDDTEIDDAPVQESLNSEGSEPQGLNEENASQIDDVSEPNEEVEEETSAQNWN